MVDTMPAVGYLDTFQRLCPGADIDLPSWIWVALSTLVSMLWSWVVSRELRLFGRIKQGCISLYYLAKRESKPVVTPPFQIMTEEQFAAQLLGRARVLILHTIALGFDIFSVIQSFRSLGHSTSKVTGLSYYNCGAVLYATSRQIRVGLSLAVTFMGATLAAARKREKQSALAMQELEEMTDDEKRPEEETVAGDDNIKLESGDSPFFLMAAYCAVFPVALFFFLLRDRTKLKWPVPTFVVLCLRSVTWAIWGLPLFFSHTLAGWIYTLFPLLFPLPACMLMGVTVILLKVKVIKYGSWGQHILYCLTAACTLVSGILLVSTPVTAMVRVYGKTNPWTELLLVEFNERPTFIAWVERVFHKRTRSLEFLFSFV